MNHAQVDYLLQLPVPRPESAPSASRGRDDAPAFDDHFRQASEESAATTSSPAAPTRPPATDRDDDQRSSTTPNVESRAAAEDTSAKDEVRETDDVTLAETAEAAAVLAPAEQVTQAVGSEAAVDAENTALDSVHPDGAPAQPAAEADGEPTGEVKVAAIVAAARAGEPDTAEKDLTAATSENASVESPESQQAAPTRDGDSPRVNAKSLGGEHGSNVAAVDGDAIEQPAVAQSAAAVHSGASTPAKKPENRKSAVDGAAKTNDKKLTKRAEAAVRDAAIPPNERTAAAVARSADVPAIAPTVANVQAQLQPGGTAPSASVDSTTKPKDAIAGVKEGLFSPFARLERNSASGAHGSRRAGRGEGAPHVDPARFVSRVARAIQTAEERGGPLQLRLSPPELGAMRLEISVNQGALTATIETENANARQLLLDNLPALRERLAEQVQSLISRR